MKFYAVMETGVGGDGDCYEAVIVCSTVEKAEQFIANAVEQTEKMWKEGDHVAATCGHRPGTEEYTSAVLGVRAEYVEAMGGFRGGNSFEIWPVEIDSLIKHPGF